MNKILTSVVLIVFICLFFNCVDCNDCTGNGNYKTKVTIIFINETSSNIKSIGCDREIAPGNTFKLEIEETLGTKPNIDNFPVSIFTNCLRQLSSIL